MAAGDHAPRLISLFYSYSHKDERYREKLETQLKILQRQGVINGWHDRKIGAGKDWASEIDHHLETAGIILLLVSDNFLASEYCYGKEMTRALARHDIKSARVIPIILQPCLWEEALFAKLQALPRDGKPVTRWSPQAEAYNNIAVGIREAARELRVV
ncbi:MAG TPA: toll/interleukin-1 receptor domain-containing protein [Candidatus Defluviicoccus seviourii]|nr:toll/interleukin-1 receptor domain-containing protein [Candidatus Defluviicoccus seviourii]